MSTSRQDVRSPDTMTSPLKKSCQSCNMAKLKCNGHRPQCARCSRRGTPCVYAPSKPVGRPPRRAALRAVAQPLYSSPAAALRGPRPTYYSSASMPPNDNSEPTESTKPYEPYKPNQCGPSPTPPQPPPQPDRSVDNQGSESCMAAAFLALDDGIQPDLHPTAPYTYSGTTSELGRGKAMALDLSFLHGASDNEFQPTMPLLTEVDWRFDEPSHFVLSPSSVELPALSLAAPTDNASEPSNGGSSTASPCICLTTVINLLLHRSKMRKKMVPEQGAALCHELEALMQQGLSVQQRCNLCLEDPLVSMIWARITDEYLTTVIALRQRNRRPVT
ncbi:hypothetical protein DL771_005409 [Monosporascus sp. 5C6A]|nr:hypothetical protein DL771_005409 [Monosporascus sp. 5C6A]